MITHRDKKFKRHFGKEENCPIWVALQIKNKFLEEKNTLPILYTKNYVKNVHLNKSKSPNKNPKFNNTPLKNNEKFKRIMSSRPGFRKIRAMRRNESAKEMISMNNRNIFEKEEDFNNKIKDNKFPCLNEYFN